MVQGLRPGRPDRRARPLRGRGDGHGPLVNVHASRVGGPGSRKVALLFNDITRRKRAEGERERLLGVLELERSRLAYLFAHAPAFVAVLRGPEHVFELVNPPYRELVRGRDVWASPCARRCRRPKAKASRAARPRLPRGRTLRRQGDVYPPQPRGRLDELFLNFVYQPIFEADGTVSGVFVHGMEVTDQVRARRRPRPPTA